MVFHRIGETVIIDEYPIAMPMVRTCRRLGTMKRKYDKKPIPEV